MAEASAALSYSARIQVVRGALPMQLTFRDGEPARMVAGSDAAASLRFSDAETAPRQFDAVWDGQHLWLQDALRLGRTFVNGHLLNEWTCVVGQALVSFGPVRLWMCSLGPAPTSHCPDFLALERARLADAHHDGYLRRRDTGRITLPPDFLRLLSERAGR